MAARPPPEWTRRVDLAGWQHESAAFLGRRAGESRPVRGRPRPPDGTMAVGERPGERWSGENGTSAPFSGEAAAPPSPDPAPPLEANLRLRESAQRQDDLLALAAGDLRGPAAALLAGLRRLRRDATGAARGLLEALEEEALRVARVAEGLGALRSFEGGQVSLRRRAAELNGLVTQAVGVRL